MAFFKDYRALFSLEKKKKEPVQDRVSQNVTLSFRIKIQLLYTVAQIKDDDL